MAIALLSVGVLLAGPTQAGLNDFSFKLFQADYHLGKDSENRATLTVDEYIVAKFPDRDQNQGIARSIPQSYNDLSLDLQK